MVCLGLGVAVSAHLLLSSVRQLFLVQAEDVMHELVLFTGLDHPTSVQTELAGCSQDVDHTLSPQLLAQDGGGDEAASSPDSSTAVHNDRA